jgi:hypothetical protein
MERAHVEEGKTGDAGGKAGIVVGSPSCTIDCSRKSSIARIAALLWRRCE